MEIAQLLKDLGVLDDGRWWRVSFDKKSNEKPIRVSLMQPLVIDGEQSKIEEELGFQRATASARDITSAAKIILTRVGSYKEVIGEYR